MAWGVDHYIEFTESEDGYIIKETAFDETLICGVSYGDVEYYKSLEDEQKSTIEIEGLFVDGGQEEEINAIHERTMSLVPTSTNYANGYPGYSPSAAIAYADTWAEGVNPYYGDYDNDCANFVSQCLFAGGVAEIKGNGEKYSYSNGWYHFGGENGGSENWIQVAAFDTFWQNQGITRVVANGSTLIPGNPLYYLNDSGTSTGHLMICVGYNVKGVPLYSAHNPNVYREPYTQVSTVVSNTLYTLCFVDVCDTHSLSYQTDATYHWIGCSECTYQQRKTAHIFVNGVCRVCLRSETSALRYE